MGELKMISIRSALLTEAAPAQSVPRVLVRPPKLALLPKGKPPGGSLLLSALVHAAGVFALLTWLPLLFPGRPLYIADADPLYVPDNEVLYMPILPHIENPGSHSDAASASKKMAPGKAKPETQASQSTSDRPIPNFPGPQVIVSDLPDWTNNIQTIRRPDLVAPPKQANPVRLQSMVMLPARARQATVAPQVDQPLQPVVPDPQELASFRAEEPRVKMPELSMGVPVQTAKVSAEAVAPKITSTSDRAVPVFSTTTPSAPKAVVVINAVSLASEPAPVIPDVEVSGSFIVGPLGGIGAGNVGTAAPGSGTTGAGNAASTGAGGMVAGAGGSTGGSSSNPIAGNASGNGMATNGSQHGTTGSGSISIRGGQPGPGGAGGTPAGMGNGSIPGISISGSTATGSSAAPAITAGGIAHRSYAITVISGGGSGGASRDLGVFSRSDTVYTVNIPMADAGGGPDWSIEYALLGSPAAGNDLVTPPFALKKVGATGPKPDPNANPGPVFVIGIINEQGKLEGLRASRASDARAQAAVNALAQWEFLPALLDGKPVASKVLIGTTVMPAEAVTKQN
jgi:hypothetical protein